MDAYRERRRRDHPTSATSPSNADCESEEQTGPSIERMESSVGIFAVPNGVRRSKVLPPPSSERWQEGGDSDWVKNNENADRLMSAIE